jgi:hypothetical protein
MRRQSTRAIGSVKVRGSMRRESRSRQASRSFTATVPTSRGDTALTEAGAQVGPTRHDILTGSNADGTLLTKGDATCRGWTSHADGRAMVGHHNRSGGGQGDSWNAAHLSRGCSQAALRASLGDGLFYCFAAD